MKKILIFLLLSTSFSAFADWRLEVKEDDFEETTNYFLFSDSVEPNKPMSWPHEKAFAYLYFSCQTKSISMRTTMNNLVNRDTYRGENRYIYINVKVDGEIFRDVDVRQDFSSDFIHFDKGKTQRRLINAKEVIIQLNHYNQGNRTYSFNMEGLKPLMVNQCALPEPKESTWTNWLNSQ